ncbi:hypothetical protein NEOKW01_0804 [Nematocida sp. AWRm80]|nr:hypothetical protein NEOKW01_0804 [Nematocida sp. AWRm80]
MIIRRRLKTVMMTISSIITISGERYFYDQMVIFKSPEDSSSNRISNGISIPFESVKGFYIFEDTIIQRTKSISDNNRRKKKRTEWNSKDTNNDLNAIDKNGVQIHSTQRLSSKHNTFSMKNKRINKTIGSILSDKEYNLHREPDGIALRDLPGIIPVQSISTVYIASGALKYIQWLFDLSNTPNHSESINGLEWEDLSGLLWALSFFYLDNSSYVFHRERKLSKRRCLRENILTLILNSNESIKKELSEILSEVFVVRGEVSSGAPPEEYSGRNKIEHIFRRPDLEWLKWYLQVSLSFSVEYQFILVQVIDDHKKKNSLKIVFSSSYNASDKNDLSIIPLSKYILDHSISGVCTLTIAIEDNLSVDYNMFIALLNVFSSVETVVFDSLGNSSDSMLNVSLIEHTLIRNTIHRSLGFKYLVGIILPTMDILTYTISSYLQDTPLETFGFHKYYRHSKKGEDNYKINKPLIDEFFSILFTQENTLSKSLSSLVAPDIFFFKHWEKIETNPFKNLKSIRILLNVQEWNMHEKRAEGGILSLRTEITKVEIVETMDKKRLSEPSRKHALSILLLLHTLREVQELDLSKGALDIKDIHQALITRRPEYSRSLIHLSLPYIISTKTQREQSNPGIREEKDDYTVLLISAIYNKIPNLSKINVYLLIDGNTTLSSVLSVLILDIYTLVRHTHNKVPLYNLSIPLHIQALQITRNMSLSYTLSELEVPHSLISSVYHGIYRPETKELPSEQELSQMISYVLHK